MVDDAAPPATARAEHPASHRIRWGLPDAAIVWVAGILFAFVGSIVGLGVTGTQAERLDEEPLVLAISAVVQFAGMLLALWLVARAKGRGSLALDFGLRARGSEWWWVLVGVATQIAAQLALLPIAALDDRRQGVVEEMEDASGVALVILALTAVALAPVVEELLFRGLLLRALLRRVPPAAAVAWSASIFGVVHLVDPGAIVVLPALVAIGVVTGIVTVRSGSLGPAILVHVGFNLLTVVALLAA